MKAVNKSESASAQKLNVLLKSTDDSTTPVTIPPATAPEWNFIINSELFLSLITMTGRCPACIVSINIEHFISEKMGLSLFIVMTVIETKSFIPQRSAVGIPILQEEIVWI